MTKGSTYSVLQWGSDPKANNDDCYTSFDTRDLAEAKNKINDILSANNCAYVELCVSEDPDSEEQVEDPTVYLLIKNPH